MEERRKARRKRNRFIENLFPSKGGSRGDLLRRVIFVLSVLILIFSLSYIIFYFSQSISNRQQMSGLQDMLQQGDEDSSAEKGDNELTKGEEDLPTEYLPKFTKLYEANKDIAAWIKIADTIVDYPVMQAENNDKYLRHDFYLNPKEHGVPFLDFRVGLGDSGNNYIVYGHNMRDGQMFGSLTNYRNLSYYKEHPTIQFDTIYEEAQWKIFGVFVTNTLKEHGPVFEYHNFIEARTNAEFEWFVDEVQKRSFIDTGVDVELGDTLLTLSTCTYEFTEARFVVVARKVREGEDATVDVSKAKAVASPLLPDIWYKLFGGSAPDGVVSQPNPAGEFGAIVSAPDISNPELEDEDTKAKEEAILNGEEPDKQEESVPASTTVSTSPGTSSGSTSSGSASSGSTSSGSASSGSTSSGSASSGSTSSGSASSGSTSSGSASSGSASSGSTSSGSTSSGSTSSGSTSSGSTSSGSASSGSSAEEDDYVDFDELEAELGDDGFSYIEDDYYDEEDYYEDDYYDEDDYYEDDDYDLPEVDPDFIPDEILDGILNSKVRDLTNVAAVIVSRPVGAVAGNPPVIGGATVLRLKTPTTKKTTSSTGKLRLISSGSLKSSTASVSSSSSAKKTQMADMDDRITVYNTRTGKKVTDTYYNILCGMVQNEVGDDKGTTNMELEAVKAQTVATACILTRGLAQAEKSGTVYRTPMKTAGAVTKEAVSEVGALLMTWDDEVIDATYFAISAGYTNNSENVWSGKVSYLREVKSPYDKNVSGYSANVLVDEDELAEMIEDSLGITLEGNPIKWFSIKERTKGGYVTLMSVGGQTWYRSNGKKLPITGITMRSVVFENKLRSTAFKISYSSSKGQFRFTTYGFGHGVGMSQMGANEMAKRGYEYDEILHHYYTDIDIVHRDEV